MHYGQLSDEERNQSFVDESRFAQKESARLQRENDDLRAELTAAHAKAASLRAGLAECQALTAAQADVIEAQRVNLEQLRNVLIALRNSNGYGLDIPEWYGDDNNRDWLTNAGVIRLARAALEGVEADGAEEPH